MAEFQNGVAVRLAVSGVVMAVIHRRQAQFIVGGCNNNNHNNN